MKHNISEFDLIFLSYDEPNAEELYAKLLDTVPWAKRVHGVSGFDAAHKACADASDTEFFVTVDGDNEIYPEFLDLQIEIEDDQHDHAWTWTGRNLVNGLIYGNGGLKLWSRKFVHGMQSHENSGDESHAVDFCWTTRYHDLLGCYSTSVINKTPYQAWRSGFREGVKMCLDRGRRVTPSTFFDRIWDGNVTRLCIWSSVGSDVENGIWAICGARMGCHRALIEDEDHTIIRDYQKMNDLWNNIMLEDPMALCQRYGSMIRAKLDLDISLLDPSDSAFFKRVYVNPPRQLVRPEQLRHFSAYRHV